MFIMLRAGLPLALLVSFSWSACAARSMACDGGLLAV